MNKDVLEQHMKATFNKFIQDSPKKHNREESKIYVKEQECFGKKFVIN
ncbi:unnamed protein product [Paramecium pentaurelia]|uniref:Uncharacterized protein n=1 Tax=Paramecium pentaurelia TaxID=43138 RepID=A0A8S1SLG5_9CILI|nr:unnamed protein product [Paramecium pentaurelia]